MASSACRPARDHVIKSLLVANRGEIACRIFRTARRLSIRTVAVYSDADADARHVRAADEALRIGPAPARESYLNIGTLLEAARASHVQVETGRFQARMAVSLLNDGPVTVILDTAELRAA